MSEFLLAADIGATKSDLAIVARETTGVRVLTETTVASRDYGGPVELLSAFLREAAIPVTRASLSVAGPVANGHVRLPNLGWECTEDEIRGALALRSASLVNDLQASACALPHLAPEQLQPLQAGFRQTGGVQAVIAPGTGLGEAFVVPLGNEGIAFPSEGGHTDFAPADEEQRELLAYLQADFGQVSYERVCSGQGIANIHRFLRETGRAKESPELAGRISAMEDPTPAIVQAGLSAVDPRSASARALEIFAAILGAEAGNLALRVLATGGVFVGGGIPPRIIGVLQQGPFLHAFRNKGPMSDLVRRIPVHLVLETRTALWGAVHYAAPAFAGRAETDALAVPA